MSPLPFVVKYLSNKASCYILAFCPELPFPSQVFTFLIKFDQNRSLIKDDQATARGRLDITFVDQDMEESGLPSYIDDTFTLTGNIDVVLLVGFRQLKRTQRAPRADSMLA